MDTKNAIFPGVMPRINDLNLKNWKQYQDILTDSLWIINERDKSGNHRGDYHGNFVPQIPNQFIRRFTKVGDVVLDPFLGSGTTLIECERQKRIGIGVELVPDIAKMAAVRIGKGTLLEKDINSEIIVGDSTSSDSKRRVEKALEKNHKKKIQLVILHPPYHDIIKFSSRKEDLSNAPTTEKFFELFGRVIDNFLDLLEAKHHLAVVIGDKYVKGEWIPLGLYTIQEVLKREPLFLKSVIVKNMVNNRGKHNQENLWRYRALHGGFYIFKHEYILLFQKR